MISISGSPSDGFGSTGYMHGYLADNLLFYQAQCATGVFRVKALAEDRIIHRVIVFRAGLIVYAGPAIPTPYEFIVELSASIGIGVIAAVLKFAAQRASVQRVMQALVENGVLKWPEIAKAVRSQASQTLDELLPTAGQFYFEENPSLFDLHYGEGINGFTMHALLLERNLHGQGRSSAGLRLREGGES